LAIFAAVSLAARMAALQLLIRESDAEGEDAPLAQEEGSSPCRAPRAFCFLLLHSSNN
jgi:hypothetical protein